MTSVAVVGMACRYPDASSPDELWCNVLAQRRAFRRLPPERMRVEDYISSDLRAPDKMYSSEAAVLDGWEFDRARFRIAGSTFRSTDLVHWLALDVAADALADAGFTGGDGLDRARTGVVVGNTLTGEFSRARTLRLRWPYVRRTVAAAVAAEGGDTNAGFFTELERAYKQPFEAVDEDTLAGSLSNTIAGRICNTFDLHGCGYTVDGACASSLLSVTTACTALLAGDLDTALAGGVDLSLDPFELVGFAKAGALAKDDMRVYDVHSSGFWPGEGCGFVVLRRLKDALADGVRVHAVVRGWGVSSDGRGGITRPELEGQLLALERAYDRAGFDIGTVPLFEGHGTGTTVGDRTELAALDRARRAAGASRRAAVGSIKANIGHTKAAAGVAGLLKAALCVREQVIPPTTACPDPHEELTRPDTTLRAVREPEPWPEAAPVRAGVSALGFGGINAHVVLEGPPAAPRRRRLGAHERALGASPQDAELFVAAAPDAGALDAELARVAGVAAGLSRAELADLAAELVRRIDPQSQVRAAMVAALPLELEEGLARLRTQLADGGHVDPDTGAAAVVAAGAPRIGFLFPGQGSPTYSTGGALALRLEPVRALYKRARLPGGDDLIDTAVAQPAIVVASLAGLAALRLLGVDACIAVGHSLGELTALHWAGGLDERALVDLAAARGLAMAELAVGGGGMASIFASPERVAELIRSEPDVCVAGLNAPQQTVVSGPEDAIRRVLHRATAVGLTTTLLPVSHAFHSPLVAPAAARLATHLVSAPFGSLQRPVASTVTGRLLEADDDLRARLVEQVTSPVRFADALEVARARADVFVEVGPGRVLAGLAGRTVPVLALDAGGPSLRGILGAAGVLWALGAPVRLDALFTERFTRPFSLDRPRRFLASPCERQPLDEAAPTLPEAPPEAAPDPVGSSFDVVRALVARRVELPETAVDGSSSLLGDLHMNSIQVAEIAAAAARALGVVPPVAPAELAGATVAQLAEVLAGLEPASTAEQQGDPPGVAAWVRAFAVDLVDAPALSARSAAVRWQMIVAPDHPLAPALADTFAGGGEEAGVVLCLPPDPDERHVESLLDAARAVQETGVTHFALVQHGGGAASFAKTLHLELPEVHTCVVDVPLDPGALAAARLEAEATRGFREVVIDAGARRVPVLRLLRPGHGVPRLGASDVLLATGGGKGIGAECALALCRTTGARAALLGRSRPEDDDALAENLRRFEIAGVEFLYVAADVRDAAAVGRAVTLAEEVLGPVTAILHAAGSNVPALLSELDADAVGGALAPKLAGLRAVLGAVDESRLKLVVGFSSVIACTGLRGEAHYAVANEWLARELDRLHTRIPDCRCLALEWSVWAGAGMGERLGVLDALTRSGVAPVAIEDGTRMLEELVDAPDMPVRVVVGGRLGRLPTALLEPCELPLHRFLDRVRVNVPGVELVVDAELTSGRDPYLADHVFEGTLLLPSVIGLEAVAQVACALTGESSVREFRAVELTRPITVPADGSRVVRIAALAGDDGEVEVTVRSDETGFQVDHFRAVCRVGPPATATLLAPPEEAGVALDSADILYEGILFQRGRFRRLRRYLDLHARGCLAEVETVSGAKWFGSYLSDALVLGDPGARDAFIHAVQACIPHERLLPVGVARIELLRPPAGTLRVLATEQRHADRMFVYDLEITDEQARLCERWHGLTLTSVGPTTTPRAWPPALLAPYVERRLEELVSGAEISVAVASGADRRARSDLALARSARAAHVLRRSDGKPEVSAPLDVSAAHVDGTTLAIAGPAPVGCDAEPVAPRGEQLWRDLLGVDGFALARVLGDDAAEALDESAARVWVAIECLRKAGRVAAPLTADRCVADGWVVLRAGDVRIATYVSLLATLNPPVAFGFLVGAGRP